MMNRSKKLRVFLTLGVLFITAGLSASFLHDRPTYMSDTVTYVAGARSFAQGEGYCSDGNPITTWPPVYSLCLSVLVRCGADSFVAFKALNVAFSVLAVGLLFALFFHFLSLWEASALAFSVGVFFPWIYYTHTILADIPFAAILAGFLLSATLYSLPSTAYRKRWLACAALLCAIAPLIRSAGLALIPALAIVTFVTFCSKSSRSTLHSLLSTVYCLLPALLLLSVWFLRNHHHTGSILGYSVGVTPEYALSLERIGITEHSLLTRIWVNLRGYAHIFVIPDQVGIARVASLPLVIHVACAAMWGLVAMGWLTRLFHRRTWPLSITFVCYAGLLLLNTWYDIRYVLPMLGLCFLFLYDGITLCIALFFRVVRAFCGSESLACSLQSVVCGLYLVLFVVGNLAFSLAGPQAATLRSRAYEGALQRMYEACQFMKDSSETGDVLVAGGPGFVPIWSARPVMSLLGRLDKTHMLISTDVPEGVRFVLLDESKFAPYREKYMEPVVEANRARLEVVFEKGDTLVYRVLDAGE